MVKKKLPSTCYLTDGQRIIDFVLAFQPDSGGKRKNMMADLRERFEAELLERGLQLEYEDKESSPDRKTAYVKIHATWKALCRQAELEDLQKPIRVSDLELKKPGLAKRAIKCIFRSDPFALQVHMN